MSMGRSSGRAIVLALAFMAALAMAVPAAGRSHRHDSHRSISISVSPHRVRANLPLHVHISMHGRPDDGLYIYLMRHFAPCENNQGRAVRYGYDTFFGGYVIDTIGISFDGKSGGSTTYTNYPHNIGNDTSDNFRVCAMLYDRSNQHVYAQDSDLFTVYFTPGH